MNLKKICNLISALANDTTLGSSGAAYERTKGWVNQVYLLDILADRSDWWFLEKTGTIQTKAEVTDGTVDLTKGSKTVSGNSTSFTSNHVGRLLISNGFVARIASYSSATSITLEKEWEGDTTTSASYSIVKDKYELPRFIDINSIQAIKADNNFELTQLYPEQFSDYSSNRADIGDPKYYVNSERTLTSYSTGTVSGTVETNTITGSGTSWVTEEIEQFDEITIGTFTYTIKSVDAEGTITIYEPLEETVSGSAYEISKYRFTVRFYPFPKELKTYEIEANRIPEPLNQDTDIPDLPPLFHHLLVQGGYIKALMHNQDPGADRELQMFQISKNKLKEKNNMNPRVRDSWI